MQVDHYLIPDLHFVFRLDGEEMGTFQNVTGLGAQIEMYEIREGGENQYRRDQPAPAGDVANGNEQRETSRVADLGEGDDQTGSPRTGMKIAGDGMKQRLGVVKARHRDPAADGEETDHLARHRRLVVLGCGARGGVLWSQVAGLHRRQPRYRACVESRSAASLAQRGRDRVCTCEGALESAVVGAFFRGRDFGALHRVRGVRGRLPA